MNNKHIKIGLGIAVLLVLVVMLMLLLVVNLSKESLSSNNLEGLENIKNSEVVLENFEKLMTDETDSVDIAYADFGKFTVQEMVEDDKYDGYVINLYGKNVDDNQSLFLYLEKDTQELVSATTLPNETSPFAQFGGELGNTSVIESVEFFHSNKERLENIIKANSEVGDHKYLTKDDLEEYGLGDLYEVSFYESGGVDFVFSRFIDNETGLIYKTGIAPEIDMNYNQVILKLDENWYYYLRT